jgi:hypothetical protein
MDIGDISEAIGNLPNTPLGALSLIIFLLAVVALGFFRHAEARIKLLIFVMLFLGGAGVAYSLLHSSGGESAAQIADECVGVDISITNPAVNAAVWCGTSGATMTTRQQAQQGLGAANPGCKSYVARNWPYLDLTQNQLHAEARNLARTGKEEDAFSLIAACQCHNPPQQAILQEGRQRVLCYLKNS